MYSFQVKQGYDFEKEIMQDNRRSLGKDGFVLFHRWESQFNP